MSKYDDIQAVMARKRREQEYHAEQCRIARSKEFQAAARKIDASLDGRKRTYGNILRACKSIESGINALMEHDIPRDLAVEIVSQSPTMRKRFGVGK